MKTKALILLAHPDRRESNLNRRLALHTSQHTDATVHELYREYPDAKIDVAREQALLVEHSAIIFQFPLYWYSSPPLLKQWQDEVLLWGFAFGPEGNKIRGKKFMVAVTAGGMENEFRHGEKHEYSLAEFLKPIEHTMRFCGLKIEKHFSLYGANKVTPTEVEAKSAEYIARINDLLKP